MLGKSLGRFLSALRARKIVEIESIRDDFRKLGLVLVGGGFLAVALNGNWLGFIAIVTGLILLYFGLTQPNDGCRSKDESDE